MKNLIVAILVLLIANIGFSFWTARSNPSVAFVRSNDLVYGYFGMREAMEEFQNEQARSKADLDTLNTDLRRSIDQAKQLHVDGRKAELARLEQVIRKQQQDLIRYQDAMEKKAGEDETRMLNGVLGQVNAFVQRYAEEKGYDLVLGTTDAGSLLYAEHALDITDEIMAALNKDHEGAGE